MLENDGSKWKMMETEWNMMETSWNHGGFMKKHGDFMVLVVGLHMFVVMNDPSKSLRCD